MWYIVGETVSLSAGASDKIRLVPPVDMTWKKVHVMATGRCEITKIEIVGVDILVAGVIELDHLKEYGNTFNLPEDISLAKGTEVIFYVKDISGAANTVYIAISGIK